MPTMHEIHKEIEKIERIQFTNGLLLGMIIGALIVGGVIMLYVFFN